MRRRTFLQAGVGAAALALTACGRPSPQSPGQPAIAAETDTSADLATIVVGADGSQPVSAIVDKYLQTGANVWHYLPNLPVFDKVDALIKSDPRIILARSYAEILAAKAAGKVSMVCGWQDSAPLEEAAGNDWRGSTPPRTKLQYYYDRGLRTANLCYNLSNAFGGGCLDPTVPLTRQGKFIIGQMQDIGILVDTGGHTGEQTSLDVIAMARRPVVCSHANAMALNDNPRNLSDRVIEGIAKTGGLVGIAALDVFMSWSRNDAPKAMTGPFPPRAGIARYADEFDYVKKLVGIDHVGLGTDFVSDFLTANPTVDWQFPPEMFYNMPNGAPFTTGFSSVLDLPALRTELVGRGYSDIDIQKVFGGNWMRVFREAWNA